MVKPPKIVIIGAGSAIFGLGAMTTLLRAERLRGAELALVDIDEPALATMTRLAELMNAAWGDADLNAGDHTDADNPIDLHYRRSWTVADDVPIPGMKRVNVTVSFPTASADSTVTLDTYITSRR